MKVYSVQTDETTYFATKGEAVTFARDLAKGNNCEHHWGKTIDVTEVTLVPVTKAVIVRLINVSGGYVEGERVVKQFKNRAYDPERDAELTR